MNVRLVRGESFNGFALGWNPRSGSVEGALPDGDYTLVLNSFGAQHASAMVPLHVAGSPVELAGVALAPTQDIPVRVRDERVEQTMQDGPSRSASDTSRRSVDFGLYARGTGAMEGQGGGTMQTRDAEPVLSNLGAGTYVLQAQAYRGYVAALTRGTTDLLRSPLVIGASGDSEPVDVTLRNDGGTVKGTVASSETSPMLALVVLVPTDGSGRIAQTVVRNDRNAPYFISNVPPGTYHALAIGGEGAFRGGLPYRDAEAMRAYEGKGTLVTVTAGQTSVAEVTLIGLAGEEVAP